MNKKILALLMVCSFAIGLTACLPESGSKKNKDKDDDEEKIEETEESESESVTEASASDTAEVTTSVTAESRESVETTTTAAIAGDTSIYHDVLQEYEDKMRILENVSYGSIDTCGLTDITGDGFPELIIQYCSDEENGTGMGSTDYYMVGDLKIFTVLPGDDKATEMLHLSSAIVNAGGGFETYAAVLSNGNLLVVSDGGDESWTTVYMEYEVDGTTLIQINQMVHTSTLNDSTDNWYYEEEYTLNDSAMTEEEYNTKLEEYKGLLSSVVAKGPYTGMYPTTELEGYLSGITENILSYDEAWEVTA